MTTTERNGELNDKIYQMCTKAWSEIFDYEREIEQESCWIC